MKDPTYTNRILREAGAAPSKRDGIVAKLKHRVEELEEQVIKERKRADLLQIDLDIALGVIRDLRDWQQRAAQQRNGAWQ